MVALSHVNVTRLNNKITFQSLASPFVVSSLLMVIHKGIKKGFSDFVLDVSNVKGVFPNTCAPIGGILDYYRRQGIDFDIHGISKYLNRTQMFTPRLISDSPGFKSFPLDTVWRFSSPEEVHLLVNAYLDKVFAVAECDQGVLPGLEWCLNETMDNVLQHAEIDSGYVMAQVHTEAKYIAICIYDFGRGIFNSLKDSVYRPKTSIEAIQCALREGVTRDKKVGQGNGMWGLHNIVKANSGLLNVSSGSGFYGLSQSEESKLLNEQMPFLSRDSNSTTVDFQIAFDKGISIPNVLGGYEPVNLRVEGFEDEQSVLTYKLKDRATGTGTRRAGQYSRNEVINLLNESTGKMRIDFSGLSVVSSSFADELLGKLIAKMGLTVFNDRCQLIGMNPTVRAIVDRSIQQRLQVTGD